MEIEMQYLLNNISRINEAGHSHIHIYHKIILMHIAYTMKMESTASLVRSYLRDNPEITNYLKNGIINISALARQIMKLNNITDFEATVAAIKRFKNSPGDFKLKMLDKSHLEMASNVSVISIKKSYSNMKLISSVISSNRRLNNVTMLDSGNLFSIIGDAETIRILWNSVPSEEVTDKLDGVGELTIISSDDIIHTGGYVNFITSLLYQTNINILHMMSFYNNTIIILDKADLTRAFTIISAKILEQ